MNDVLFREGISDVRTWDVPLMVADDVVIVVEAPSEAEPVADAQQLLTAGHLEELEQQAREEGFAAGREEGLLEGREEIRQRIADIGALMTSIARPLATMDERVELELARLAMTVARQVVANELNTAPDLVVSAVRKAVALLPSSHGRLRIHLHPDDVALLKQLDAVERDWDLVADPSLQRGDSVLQTTASRMDARLETRLATLVTHILRGGDDAGDEHA